MFINIFVSFEGATASHTQMKIIVWEVRYTQPEKNKKQKRKHDRF